MVLHSRRDPELLAFRSVRPKLDISVVESNNSSMANRHLGACILRWLMDRLPLPLLTPIGKPLLDSPCFRYGSRCSSVGADTLEHLANGSVSALDSRTSRQYTGRTVFVAMAWVIGCHTRSW